MIILQRKITCLITWAPPFKIIFRPHCAAEVHHHWRPPSFLQPSWADNLEIPILSGYMIHESGTDPYYPFRKASWTWSILRVLTPQRLCSAGGCSFVALFPWHYLCDMRTHLLISWSLQSVPHIGTFFGGHFSLEEVVSQKILRGFFRVWLLYCYCCGSSVEEQAFYIAVHNYIW